MPRNGSGTQTSPVSSFPAVANTLIESSKFNNVINDINASLTASIANDGQTPILANLPMSGFKHTGASAGSSSGEYVEYGQFIALLPIGTKIPFYQASPPVGWSIVAIQNDSMMRVVTGATTGGTSNAGAGHSPILNNVVPSHTHTYSGTTGGDYPDHTHVVNVVGVAGAILGSGGSVIGNAQSGGASNQHAHDYSGTTTGGGSSATNWRPRYMDFCVGEKS